MFATRRDQENLAHVHSTNAAAKPLNQGVTKTPGPKNANARTPFRARNDENALRTVSKTGGGKAALDLFATPAQPRTRPVLGAKTTNAKALATPGQGLKTTQKPVVPPSTQKVSPRLKRSKVRVHQAPAINVELDDEDSAPEVEYCPPPGSRTPPLLNHPDGLFDLPLDSLFTRDDDLSSDMAQRPGNRDENGQTASDRAFDARLRDTSDEITRKMESRSFLEQMSFSDPDLEQARLTALQQEASSRRAPEGVPAQRKPSTLSSRSAAAMLSSRPLPNFAAPTQATQAKATDAAVGTGKENSAVRFSTAKALSNTTMGYSKGRRVSATKRTPLSAAHRTPVIRAPSGRVRGARPQALEVLGLDGETVHEEDKRAREEDAARLDEAMRRLACEDFVLDL